MRFLADQDVWAVSVRFLREHGHDVVTASELKLSTSQDEDLLKQAKTLNRIMITRDRDYGGLVFVKYSGRGVIYLRISPATISSVHNQLLSLLTSYSETELKNAFVVVEPARFRFRKLKE